MSTDDILDAIDHALHDTRVSVDAMRWSPEAPPEEHTAADAWDARERDEAGARYRAALAADPELREEPLSDPHRYARSIGCTCFDTLADVCPRHPGADLSEWTSLGYTEDGASLREMGNPRRLTEEYIAGLFEVPVDVIRRTFGACACPESGHLATCVIRTVTHREFTYREPASLAGHMERALERMEGRQGRAQERMEGARETYSVLDEIRRWSSDPRSPIARAGHDFSVGNRRCPGCKAIRGANARITSYGPDAQDLVDAHTRWHREHEWVEDMMRQYRIPLRGDDPLPYYRALWRNAQLHGDRMPPDVPHCRLCPAERGMKPYLFLGGQSPWDGSVMYLTGPMGAINVADTVGGIDALDVVSPVAVTIPTDTYTAHRFRYLRRGGNITEAVYLCGVTAEYAFPIVGEAIHRGLIGPDAWRRADRREQ